MIRVVFGTILLILTFLFFSCSPVKKASDGSKETKQVKQDTVLFASIQRTACYGKCPSYEARIYENGCATYEGKMFVEKKGTYSATISKEDLATLLALAKDIGYFGLDDKYDSNITDLPACLTSVKDGEKLKSIYNRHGGPDALKQFQKQFDTILNKQQWTKIADPEVNYQEDND